MNREYIYPTNPHITANRKYQNTNPNIFEISRPNCLYSTTMLVFYLYSFFVFHLIKIFISYIHLNFYFICYIKYYSSLFLCNSLYLWFLIFMYIVLFNLLYYAGKKLYAKSKYTILVFFYFILYYIISILFLSEDCLFFIVSFETMLFSILVLSMHFIFNNRFIIAMYYLITFTILSGLGCFLFLFIVLININLTGYFLLLNAITLNNFYTLTLLWYVIYIIFGIKFPIYPFYFWLLAVHVEVSSEMSTMLAGIILKSGFIGIFKFLVVLLSYVTHLFSAVNTIFVIIGVLSCAINLLIITDYKKIIGSWSILHVNVTLMFIWYNNYLLVLLFILSNLGHVLSSSSFFLCISFTYENFNNKHIFLISSAFNFNIYSFLFIFLILNNIDFPFFLLFYIELLNFFAIMFISNYLAFFLIAVVLVLFVSSLLLYFILNYYQYKWNNLYIRTDLSISDFSIFFNLIIYSLILFWWVSLF